VGKRIRNSNWNVYAVTFLIFLLIFQANAFNVSAESFKTKAESAIIVEVDSGKVLYEKNADEALPPASMTKMMTEYIVLEKVASGEISWDDTTQISDYAYEISGNDAFSGVGLIQDKDYTILELYEAMAINSDNATTIAIAEYISGSEGEFVKLMNEKAEEMGLPDYKFVNSTGLDNESLDGKHPEGTKADDTNLLSARSAALLAYRLIKDYPEVLEISSVPETTFDEQTIENWNWMLPHEKTFLKQYYYEGIDGLKTGHTDLAGYTFTSTAERDGRRLITVVMKTDSIDDRFHETAKLLDFGFDKFEEVELFEAGYQLKGEETLPVLKGKEEEVAIGLEDSITQSIQKGTEDLYSIVYHLDKNELEAPVKKGEVVGKAEVVFDDGKELGYIENNNEKGTFVDIVIAEDVDKKGWFALLIDAFKQLFKGD